MSGLDAPGTCHLVGCPGKGTVDEHVRKPIGCPDDFTSYDADRCLGRPSVAATGDGDVRAVCSIAGRNGWASCDLDAVTPRDMARLVDRHRVDCTNRSPR